MSNMENKSIKETLQEQFPDLGNIEPEIFRDFIAYWRVRKNFSSEEFQNLKPSQLINLIESNHKFRELYGEEIASELVKIIEIKNDLKLHKL